MRPGRGSRSFTASRWAPPFTTSSSVASTAPPRLSPSTAEAVEARHPAEVELRHVGRPGAREHGLAVEGEGHALDLLLVGNAGGPVHPHLELLDAREQRAAGRHDAQPRPGRRERGVGLVEDPLDLGRTSGAGRLATTAGAAAGAETAGLASAGADGAAAPVPGTASSRSPTKDCPRAGESSSTLSL